MGSLSRKTILLTASAEIAAQLAPALERLGARVESRPTIELLPPSDPTEAWRAVAGVADFDWIVFTSRGGVRFFLAALDAHGTLGRSAVRGRIAAVGPGTADELRRGGLRPAVVAEKSEAEGLVEALASRVAAGQRALVVRAEVARESVARGLRELGVEVQPVAFYRNAAAGGAPATAQAVREGRYDVTVFTSPSSLRRLLDALPHPERAGLRRALAATVRVAIGRVTARALSDAGLPADAVAAEPTAEGLTAALSTVLGAGSRPGPAQAPR